jgi:hypothetical protein
MGLVERLATVLRLEGQFRERLECPDWGKAKGPKQS